MIAHHSNDVQLMSPTSNTTGKKKVNKYRKSWHWKINNKMNGYYRKTIQERMSWIILYVIHVCPGELIKKYVTKLSHLSGKGRNDAQKFPIIFQLIAFATPKSYQVYSKDGQQMTQSVSNSLSLRPHLRQSHYRWADNCYCIINYTLLSFYASFIYCVN